MDISSWSMDQFSCKGLTAIVTGGNRGLGQGYAVALAKAGASLFVPTADADCSEIESIVSDLGVRLTTDVGDLTDETFRQATVARCLEEHGRIDVLVNNAGTIVRRPLLDATAEEWNKVIDLNLNSVYHLSHSVARVMVNQKRGKIINIASLLSFRGGIFAPSYPASKHAVVGLTKAFANQLAKYNIQVNAIAPGYIGAGNSVEIMGNEEANRQLISRVPAGRWGEVSDLMGLAVFLSSAASDYVTGGVFPVDGGWLAM